MQPHTSYIIFATQRSGSTLLCEALRNTQVAGNPAEFFTQSIVSRLSQQWELPADERAAYLQKVHEIGTTPNGVFGFKLIWPYFGYCLDVLRQIEGNERLSDDDLLKSAFPAYHAVMITRRDKVRQAISFWRALHTKKWQQVHPLYELTEKLYRAATQRPEPTSGSEPTAFDFQEVEKCLDVIMDNEKEMQSYFASHDIHPFTVVYEDFVDAYEETALQLLDYLHIPVPQNLSFVARRLIKQANDQTEDWVRQYHQMKQRQEISYL